MRRPFSNLHLGSLPTSSHRRSSDRSEMSIMLYYLIIMIVIHVLSSCVFSSGVLLGVFLNRSVPEHRPLLFFFRCSLTLLFGALLMHGALQKIGADLSWWVQCYIQMYIYLILLANITGIRYGPWTNQLTTNYIILGLKISRIHCIFCITSAR